MSSKISRTTIISFAAMIFVGVILLALPAASSSGSSLGFHAALFTATSAVCVTGLTVVDTGRDFSPLGQVFLLILIQVGGLGFITFSTLVMLTVTGRSDLSSRLYVLQTHGGARDFRAIDILKRVIGLTLLLEFLGATALLLRIGGIDPSLWTRETIWNSVFHAVSAFCNAGFSLHSDSLMTYRDDPIAQTVIMLLITSGGFGFLVLTEVIRHLRRPAAQRRWWRLSLHTQVVLASSAFLILVPPIFFAFFEWGNTSAERSLLGRVFDALFLSVTSRTAGFNTVDTGSLTSASLTILLALMMIGASPGSTGGGIKTTSAAILFATTLSNLRGRPHAELFGRRLVADQIAKAMATITAFVAIVFFAGLALQVTESGFVPNRFGGTHFLEYIFEVVSALATVGLSTGMTDSLSGTGQMLLVLLMFLGRLGPLVVGASLIGESTPLAKTFPQERILVG